MTVVWLFIVQWQLSVFCQSFFLHRYGAHSQFSMSKGWERFFNALTAITQNSSYLNPRGYAVLHRMHHAYSDTPGDPHSPKTYGGIVPGLFKMMYKTKRIYHGIAYHEVAPEPRFDGEFPHSPFLDWMGKSWAMRVIWALGFAVFYYFFATAAWQWLLLPGHWLMGAVHGAIVNWSGHRYGYRNFDVKDVSRNSLPIDFLTAGELYQNNHHKFPMSPNFAARWWELDTTYQVMKLLNFVGIIDMSGAQKMRYQATAAEPVGAP
ncbi:MAG: acyl-CoA desaturase [Deltaproteobacteria bacterium]|nr:acyl-CoA desaturase [Deltaproteobacteria bacterium]